MKKITGMESLAGKEGIAFSDLDPNGEVRVDGIIWKAQNVHPAEGPVKKGEHVIVDRVSNLTLFVRRKTV